MTEVRRVPRSRELELIENLQRRDLTTFDQVRQMVQALDEGVGLAA